jgi:multiple sugar transport system substrate-binding protein
MKTRFKCIYVLTLILLVALICLPGNATEEPVTITFWQMNAAPTFAPPMRELISRFEAENPNIKVEYVGLPWEEAGRKFNLAAATDSLPDCSSTTSFLILTLVQMGKVYPLDDYFDAWEEAKYINPVMIDTLRSWYDGPLYLIPRQIGGDIFYYRKDWFNEAGMEAPKTMEDFYKTIEKFTDPAENRFGFAQRGGHGNYFQWQCMVLSEAGATGYFDEDGICTINNEEIVKATENLANIYKKGYTPRESLNYGYKEMVAAFGAGVSAILHHNLGSLAEHHKNLGEDKFDVFPIPLNAQGFRTLKQEANGYAVYKGTEHPNEAWKLISYLAGEVGASYWNEQVAGIPVHEKIYEHDWLRQNRYILTVAEMVADEKSKIISEPFWLPDFGEYRISIMTPDLQALYLGDITAREMLDKWAHDLTEMQQEYLITKD